MSAAAVFVAAGDDDDERSFKARLRGYQEIPAISTGARGTFKAVLSADGTSLSYELTYSGLSSTVLQAHIHFGQKDVNGGISAWLCGTAGLPGPAGTPTCPQSGTVSGTIDASDVVGPAGQGIAAGEFAELLAAMEAGVTYANVHSSMFPGGEIRGQISGGDD